MKTTQAEEQAHPCMKTKYITTSIPILAVHTKKRTIQVQGGHLGRQEQPISIMHWQCKMRGAASELCICLFFFLRLPNFIIELYRIWAGAKWLNHLLAVMRYVYPDQCYSTIHLPFDLWYASAWFTVEVLISSKRPAVLYPHVKK